MLACKLVDLAGNRVSAAHLLHPDLAGHAAVIAIVCIIAGARLNVAFASLFLLQIVTVVIMQKINKMCECCFFC